MARTSKRTALLIMAAGMGSRFGGDKQTVSVTSEGDRIIDFSMYDARKAGFTDLVFVIRRDMYESFRADIGKRAEKFFKVSYVFQEVDLRKRRQAADSHNPADRSEIHEDDSIFDTGPEDALWSGRTKPWGTGQAVLAAVNVIDCPFCVINADDFYGRDAFKKIHDFLSGPRKPFEYAMVGYMLDKTVTENGSVSRGVCEIDGSGMLARITERTKIVSRPDGIYYTEDEPAYVSLPEDATVSMNFWGFGPEFFRTLSDGFARFLREEAPKDPLKKEYYLPDACAQAMREGALVRVLKTDAKWYGVTYAEDLESVKDALQKMKETGIYPRDLHR